MEFNPTSLPPSLTPRYFPLLSDTSRCITMHSCIPLLPVIFLFPHRSMESFGSTAFCLPPFHTDEFLCTLRIPSLPIAFRSPSIAARDRCYERRAAVLFVGAGGWQVAHEWRYFLKSRPGCQSLSKYWMRVGNLLAAEWRREGDIGVPVRGGILVRAALGVSLC